MVSNKINDLITATISKISGITKPRRKFVTQLLMLYMGLRGRYTFTNLARYGKLNEKTYRNQFGKPFSWGDFNKELIRSERSKELIAVFDPTKGEQKPGRGRKRIYGAKVDLSYIDRRRIKLFLQGD